MFPVLLEFGAIKIYSYGALIALGGAAALWLMSRRRKLMGLEREEDFWALLNLVLAGGFVGGRLLHLAEYTAPFSPEFWSGLLSLRTGFSAMGAFAGAAAACGIYCRRKKLPFLKFLDGLCLVAPLWHAFGRLGCLAAGCCYGRPAPELSWAVTFRDPRGLVAPALLGRPLHPAQLYEAAADLALAALLWVWARPRADSGRWAPGVLAGAYIGGYCLIRFFLENFRADGAAFSSTGLTWAQALCVAYAAAVVYLARRRPA